MMGFKRLAQAAFATFVVITLISCSDKPGGSFDWRQPYEPWRLVEISLLSLIDLNFPPQGVALTGRETLSIETRRSGSSKVPSAYVNLTFPGITLNTHWLRSFNGLIYFYANSNYPGLTDGSRHSNQSRKWIVNHNYYYAPDDLPMEVLRVSNSRSFGFAENGHPLGPFTYRPWNGHPDFSGTIPATHRAYGFPTYQLQNGMLPFAINTPRFVIRPNNRDWKVGTIWNDGKRYGEYQVVQDVTYKSINSQGGHNYEAVVEWEIYAFPR